MPVCELLSNGYFKCLNKLWMDEELCDFTVQIDDVSIKCHRVILGACSSFFLGLLRSGMKEANEGRVVLQDISASTFQLILKTLYTGEDVLSLDNFIEIWHAVHMLQIGFFLNMCETFAVNNLKLDNFEEIYSIAKLLNARSVSVPLNTFMLENFDAISETKPVFELSFKEFQDLVEKPTLKSSSEYNVLQSVIKWTEYNPIAHKPDIVNIGDEGKRDEINSEPVKDPASIPQDTIHQKGLGDIEKAVNESNGNVENEQGDLKENSEATKSEKGDIQTYMQPDSIMNSQNSNIVYKNVCNDDRLKRLRELLRTVRISLISPSLLVQVLEHPLIKLIDEAKQEIVSAILNETTYFRHGQWPTTGRYRECYEYGNYGCFSSCGSLDCIDPDDEKWYTLNKCESLKRNVQLVVFDNELFATGVQSASQNKSKMFLYYDNSWAEIAEMPGKDLLLASNDNHIYVTNVIENIIYRLSPKRRIPKLEHFIQVPKENVIKHVMSYQIYMLIFCTENVNDIDETAVHMLDLQAKSWTRLNNLEGSAENIISFRNDDNHFVLQTNGSLWSVRNNVNEKITFTHVAKLWSIKKVMYGAVVHGNILVLFGENPENDTDDSTEYELGNIFLSIRYWGRDGSCSNFIPAVLLKSGCTPKVIK
ncbi:kelch-like protein 41b [Physella acuta]|uniref:kelch-like protein 41b n=1 Tax=Physella acuta TaxID=109671 RepID=UPI0027DC2471|nr:kelch-like protein 41b [Physella acuta]XP_059169540.1 kelch-like protein 41b [Physella acuta]